MANSDFIQDFINFNEDHNNKNIPNYTQLADTEDDYDDENNLEDEINDTQELKKINQYNFICSDPNASVYHKWNLNINTPFKSVLFFDVDSFVCMLNGNRNFITSLNSNQIFNMMNSICDNYSFDTYRNKYYRSLKKTSFMNMLRNFSRHFSIIADYSHKEANPISIRASIPITPYVSTAINSYENSIEVLKLDIANIQKKNKQYELLLNICNLKFKSFVLGVCLNATKNHLNCLKKSLRINNGSHKKIRDLNKRIEDYKYRILSSYENIERNFLELKSDFLTINNNHCSEIYNQLEDNLRSLMSDKITLTDKSIEFNSKGLRFFEQCSTKSSHVELYSFVKDYVFKHVLSSSKSMQLQKCIVNCKKSKVTTVGHLTLRAGTINRPRDDDYPTCMPNLPEPTCGLIYEIPGSILLDLGNHYIYDSPYYNYSIAAEVSIIISDICKSHNSAFLSYANLSCKYKSLIDAIENYNDDVDSYNKGNLSLPDTLSSYMEVLSALDEYVSVKNDFRILINRLANSLEGITNKNNNNDN